MYLFQLILFFLLFFFVSVIRTSHDVFFSLIFWFLVPPGHVTVSGPRKLRNNEVGTFKCEAAPALPAPQLNWRVTGKLRKFNYRHY